MAGDAIGTTTDPLDIELTGGSVAAQAASDISLEAVSGDLIVSNIVAQGIPSA